MESTTDLSLEITVRPSDLYDPWEGSWQNLLRWVFVLFVGYLVYETRPVWSAASSDAGVRDALVALSLLGLWAFLALFLFPYLRLRYEFRKYPGRQWTQRISFRTEGIHIDTDEAGGDYKWSFFTRITETPKVFLFCTKGNTAVYIPKRRVPQSSDVTKLRGIIKQNYRGKLHLRRD